MKYNKYIKELGITRWQFFKFNHYNIRNEFEKIEYGTNYHEMWSLDTFLAVEIYVRLRHLHDKYHWQCNFSDRNVSAITDIECIEYERVAIERFDKVIYAFETIIKIYFDLIEEEYYEGFLDDPNSQNNKVLEGLKIFGEGMWGCGI